MCITHKPNVQQENVLKPNVQQENVLKPNVQQENVLKPNVQQENVLKPNAPAILAADQVSISISLIYHWSRSKSTQIAADKSLQNCYAYHILAVQLK